MCACVYSCGGKGSRGGGEGEEKEGVVGKPASWALPRLGVGTRATSLTTEEGSKK